MASSRVSANPTLRIKNTFLNVVTKYSDENTGRATSMSAPPKQRLAGMEKEEMVIGVSRVLKYDQEQSTYFPDIDHVSEESILVPHGSFCSSRISSVSYHISPITNGESNPLRDILCTSPSLNDNLSCNLRDVEIELFDSNAEDDSFCQLSHEKEEHDCTESPKMTRRLNVIETPEEVYFGRPRLGWNRLSPVQFQFTSYQCSYNKDTSASSKCVSCGSNISSPQILSSHDSIDSSLQMYNRDLPANNYSGTNGSPLLCRDSEFSFRTDKSREYQGSETTLMIRNIPNKLHPVDMAYCLRYLGYGGEFNFIYTPIDFETGCNLGYSFVNFTGHATACNAMGVLNGTNMADVCLNMMEDGHKSLIDFYDIDSAFYMNRRGCPHSYSQNHKISLTTAQRRLVEIPSTLKCASIEGMSNELRASLRKCRKLMRVNWAKYQGIQTNLRVYYDSAVSSRLVSSNFKPLIFPVSSPVHR